jgi:hypothetical protein
MTPQFHIGSCAGMMMLAACTAPTPGAVAQSRETAIGAAVSEAAPSGVDLPEGFPALRFPGGTVIVSVEGGQPPEYASRNFSINADIPGSAAEVARFYREELPKSGYEILDVQQDNATLIRFKAPGLDDASILAMDGWSTAPPRSPFH